MRPLSNRSTQEREEQEASATDGTDSLTHDETTEGEEKWIQAHEF